MGRFRISRRAAISGLLVVPALALVTLGAAVVGHDGGTASLRTALPLHPVAGSFKPDDTTIDDCSEQICYEQAYGNLAYYEGPERAIAALERNVGFRTNACHRIVHSIGSATLARNDGNVGKTFAQGSSTCASGYYHGVLERSLVNVQSYAASALGGVARGLCDDPAVRRLAELEYQCLHGLGHGLMITTGYDLPRALRVCDHLRTEWEATSCNGGAFMENISTSYGTRSRYVDDRDAIYPCNAVQEEDKLTCYQLVTSRILQIVGVDWEEVARLCSTAEPGWVQACFQSMGRDVSGQTRRQPADILEACAVARPYDGERECIRFAAMDLTGNDPSGRTAASFCASAESGLRTPCYEAIGTIMGRFRATERARREDCRRLVSAPGLVAACDRGASSTEVVTRNG